MNNHMPNHKMLTGFAQALRSGRYKQTQCLLRGDGHGGNDDCYCAMGVGMDVLNPSGWYQDGPVWKWTGPGINMDLESQIITRNDTFLQSFEEIAAFLEGYRDGKVAVCCPMTIEAAAEDVMDWVLSANYVGIALSGAVEDAVNPDSLAVVVLSPGKPRGGIEEVMERLKALPVTFLET